MNTTQNTDLLSSVHELVAANIKATAEARLMLEHAIVSLRLDVKRMMASNQDSLRDTREVVSAQIEGLTEPALAHHMALYEQKDAINTLSHTTNKCQEKILHQLDLMRMDIEFMESRLQR